MVYELKLKDFLILTKQEVYKIKYDHLGKLNIKQRIRIYNRKRNNKSRTTATRKFET